MVTALIILFLNTAISVYYIYKKNNSFWAFAIFFQHIPLIVFNKLNVEIFAYVYFVLLILICVVRMGNIEIKKSKIKNPITISLYLFVCVLYFHYFYLGIDSGNVTGFKLIYRYTALNIPVFIICLMFFPTTKESYKLLMDGVIVYGLIFILTVFFVSGLSEVGLPDRGTFRDDYRISALHVAKVCGIILIASLLLFEREKQKLIRLFSGAMAILSSIMILITASRAALLFFLLSMFFYYIFNKELSKKKFLYFFMFFGFLIFGAFLVIELDLPVLDRLKSLENYESMLRFQRIKIAIRILNDFEMGFWGLGPFGFGYLTWLNYPHNYILEMLVDYGFIGFISATMLIFFGFYSAFSLIRSESPYQFKFIGILFVYLFLCSLTSGDVVDGRQMYFISIFLANIAFYLKVNRIKR